MILETGMQRRKDRDVRKAQVGLGIKIGEYYELGEEGKEKVRERE